MGILDDAIREHLELKRTHGAPEDEIRRKEAEAFGQAQAREAAAAQAALEEQTQLISPDDHLEPAPEDPYAVHPGDELVADPDAAATPPAPTDLEPTPADLEATAADLEPTTANLEPLEPAPEDPYAVHPGDEPVPDSHADAPPAAEAGAGTLEPSGIEAGPPTAPDHHHDEQHPALVDHDHIGGEEHAPDPVYGHAAEAPTAPPDAPLDPAPIDDPPVGDPPVEEDEDVLEETPEFLQDAPEHDRLWFEQKPPRDFDFGE
jgi:hypothetical protein